MTPNQGLRETKQKTVILDELRRDKSHPSADELYRRVRRRLPKISLGTVYRNLELLSEQGVVLKLDLAGTQRRFDGDLADHHHVRCTTCGRVDDLKGEPPCCLEEAFKNTSGYKITGHRLELTGLCPKCRKTEARTKRLKGTRTRCAKR
jgi:Fur family ferric uptake transcriptional regulator